MIRVLQVIGAMDRGGAETMLMNLHRAIDRDQVQFDYLVHEKRRCDYDDEIEKLGGRIFRVPRYTIANAVAYRRLVRAHLSQHPEHTVVHGHIGSCATQYLQEAKRAGRYAIAHSHAQNFLPGAMGLAFRVMTRGTRNVADYFMACSREAGIDRFGKEVVESDRFRVVNNGIDAGRYVVDSARHEQARAALGLGPSMDAGGAPVIGHVGRLAPEKNHGFLLEAFSGVLEVYPEARLVFVGRGPLEDGLRADVRARGMEERVVFAGVTDDVPLYLAAFDVFALPSVREGLSMAAVEAQAAGLPTLLSTGVPEAACVSDSAERLPLEAGPRAWSARLCGMCAAFSAADRAKGVAQVRAAGFDVRDVARELQAFYLARA